MKEQIVKIIASHPMFRSLDLVHREAIAEFSKTVSFSRGVVVFAEGANAEGFFIVLSGRFKLYRFSAEGKEQIILFLGPNEMMAEAAIYDTRTYPLHCKCLDAGDLLFIPREKFTNCLLENPEVALHTLSVFSKKMRHLVGLVASLTLDDIRKRLTNYLCDHTVTKENVTAVELNISKKELANHLGTTPESLSRQLNWLKSNKLIEEKNKSIFILDLDALMKIS